MSMPSVFGLPHLSEDAVAAFADGVLSASAAARARRHCQECAECAEAVRGQRETAMMLRSTMAPSLPSGLLDRLACLPMSTPLPPPSSGLPTAIGADGVPVFVAFQHSSPDEPAGPEVAEQDENRHSMASRHGWHAPRRAVLPMGLLASAAAVVAAGTLGGQVQFADGGQHGNSANLSGVIATTPSAAPRVNNTARLGSSTGYTARTIDLVPIPVLTAGPSAPGHPHRGLTIAEP
ncbi:MAG: hypothetical protein QOK10_3149 [Pseudonocardiales bacterium]|jgi:anti-sigma factor RsiW|nr:hypothetical protein [Pseudonocardiales bacterium]